MVQNKKYNAAGANKGKQYSAVNYNVNETLGAGGGHQPGSTFKLFTLIGWLKSGHSLGQTVNGNARTIPSSNFTKCGSPDYDDKPFSFINDTSDEKGNYTVLRGTAGSVNGVFASMAEEQDLCTLRKQAQAMGAVNARGGELADGPSSSIGGASSIAPLDMAKAYATIANHGVTCNSIAIDKVIDAAGKRIPVPKADCRRTLDVATSNAAVFALRGVVTGGTMYGDQTPDNRYVFGKTGTTDDAKDTWAIGSTSAITTAVWVGNATGYQNLREVFGFPYCAGQGTTAATERHCIFREIQTNANRVYGGATTWTYPDSQFLYGGKAIVNADARPKAPKPKPKPKPTPGPIPGPIVPGPIVPVPPVKQ